MDYCLAAVGAEGAGDTAEKGALSRTVPPDDTEGFSTVDREGNMIERNDFLGSTATADRSSQSRLSLDVRTKTDIKVFDDDRLLAHKCLAILPS